MEVVPHKKRCISTPPFSFLVFAFWSWDDEAGRPPSHMMLWSWKFQFQDPWDNLVLLLMNHLICGTLLPQKSEKTSSEVSITSLVSWYPCVPISSDLCFSSPSLGSVMNQPSFSARLNFYYSLTSFIIPHISPSSQKVACLIPQRKWNRLEQWFATFLVLQPFNAIPHGVVTINRKISFVTSQL